MKENQLNNKPSEELQFVSIDTLKKCILQEINDYNGEVLDKESVIRDFVFICYFLEMILPHIPSIDIKCYDKEVTNGIDLLLQAYSNVYTEIKEYLLIFDEDNNIKYNQVFLQSFLEYISSFENDFFIHLYNSKKEDIIVRVMILMIKKCII